MGTLGWICQSVQPMSGSVSEWARQNVPTLAAWLGMLITMVVGSVSQWTLMRAEHDQTVSRIERVEIEAEQHAAEIVQIKSDVRSITEAHDRLDRAVTRQEDATRNIDRLTVELKAVVQTLEAKR